VEPEAAPNRVTKGLGRHSVPVVLLTRLAVDRSVQGAGLGVSLLQDAMIKVVEIAETVAVRALLVHAKDAEAKTWYLGHARFAESPADPMRLFLLIKDIKATLTAVR
jgi:GNAT superfamily N-acetyltransferase